MDIEEMRKEKDTAEVAIADILCAFEMRTRTKIENIEIVRRLLVMEGTTSTISEIVIDVRL